MKLLAATQFVWAGLAFGVALQPAAYLFTLVCIGSLVILGHVARVAGSFRLQGTFTALHRSSQVLQVNQQPRLAAAGQTSSLAEGP